MGRNLVYILVGLIIILLATVGYFIFQNQQLLSQVTKQGTSPSQAPSITSPTPQTDSSPSLASPSPTLTLAKLQENIEAAINSQNFAALTTYMTNPVQVILQATECCPDQTPSEAHEQLNYIKEGIPFDFDQITPTVKNLKSKNPELASQFIGIAKSKEHLVAFNITAENKIDAIRMAVTWKLFNY